MDEGLVERLLKAFPYLSFEARKDVARIFSNLARHNWGGERPRACFSAGVR